MLQDGKIICDSCHNAITRVTDFPAEGWPQLHSLCSNCYAELKKKSVPR
jgi:hypothetical protein